MIVEPLVAFAGGVLSLLSPCSALLLPAFFAYAFPSPAHLAARTAVFYAGMLTLLVPLGIGAGALGGVLVAQRSALMTVAGLLLILIGAIQLIRGGFELPTGGGQARPMTAERAVSTYALGLGYGLGGFCAGPILGGVLTVAASSGGALPGALLLAAYAAGMAAPLFGIALLWDRLGAARRGRLRGWEVSIGPIRRHITILVSSVMFMALGVTFVILEGANPAAGIYAALGLDDLSVGLQATVARLAHEAPVALVGAPLAVVGVVAVVHVLRRRRSRSAAQPGSPAAPGRTPR